MKAVKKGLRGLLVGGTLLAATLAVLVLAGVFRLPGGTASTGRAKGTQPQAVAVTVAPAAQMAIQRSVTMVGNLFGYEEATITPKVEGRVVKIRCDVGDVVKPGETLLEIEDVDYRLAVAEAQRGLELELAKIGLTELPKGELDVNRIPTVARAKTVVGLAQVKLSRAETLRGRGAQAQEEFDQIQADHGMAGASLEQAIMEARATLASARHKQALLETAKQRLAETSVLVPVPSPERLKLAGRQLAGVVLPTDAKVEVQHVEYVVAQRMVSEGEMVRAFPSVAVFRLVIDRPLKLVALIPERYVGEVKVGQPVSLVVEAYAREVFKGTVVCVNPTVDRVNRTLMIEVHVPNEARRLKAGSFAKATVFTHEESSALAVPEEALVTFAGVTKVFVVEDGKARAVPVKPGERLEVQAGGRSANWVEVVGDLRAGSLVVTSGHSQLAESSPVRIRSVMDSTDAKSR